MKLLLLSIAAFAAIQSVSCFTTDPAREENEALLRAVKAQILKERLHPHSAMEKLKNSLETICPGYGSRVENVTLDIRRCIILMDTENETMCSLIQDYIPRCLTPLTDLLEECLPSGSRDLPSMILNMQKSVIRHICKSDGEHIFELANPCFMNVNVRSQRCLRRVSVKIEDYSRRNKFPSSAELCEIIEGLRPCLQSHLNYACGNHITRESFLGIYDEVLSVCNSYQQNEIDVINPIEE